MKIMHVLLSRGFSGSERSTAESCNQQCIDHDVTLVIRQDHRKRGLSIRDHIDPRVTVIELASKVFTFWLLMKVIGKFKPEVIHCHLRRATRLISKIEPIAATVSTLHIKINSSHFLRMDGLICNARWQMEQIPATYSGQVFKANNSLVPHPALPKENILRLRTELGVSPNDILIGAVGRMHHSKAWDTLIKAFKQTKNSTTQLLFFGNGKEEDTLKALAADDNRIHFHGFREDIKDIYQCFDLFVCPSRFEPLPRVILEAMDAGVPVIASDVGGCKELIDDYGGDIFAVDNIDQLSQLLAANTVDKPQRHRPDLSAHHVANANNDIVTFYQELINDLELLEIAI